MAWFCGKNKICIALFIVMLTMCSLFFFCIHIPQKEEIDKRKLHLKEQQAKLSEINNFLKLHNDSESYRQEMEDLCRQSSIRFPDRMEQGAFLTDIQEKALLQSIQLSGIVPGKTEAYDAYFALPVQVSFRCTYFQLIDFLQSLNESERFFAVQSVNVHAASHELECKLQMLVYSSNN